MVVVPCLSPLLTSSPGLSPLLYLLCQAHFRAHKPSSRSFGIKAINTLLEEQASLMGWLSMPSVAWCGFQSAFGLQAHHGMDS